MKFIEEKDGKLYPPPHWLNGNQDRVPLVVSLALDMPELRG